MGRMILKAGDNGGDEPSSAGGSDGSGRDLEDSPEPNVRACLEGGALLLRLCGTGEGARGPTLV